MWLTRLDPQNYQPLEQWCLEEKDLIRIGRNRDLDIVLTETLVSRVHLELRRLDRADSINYYCVNYGTNGTFINGVLLSKGMIHEGDLIQLAQGGPLFQLTLNPLKLTPPLTVTPSPSPAFSGCSHGGNPPGNLFCIHCGKPLKIEREIAHYLVLRTLGQGGMGTTYLAWDQQKAQQQTPETSPFAALIVLKEMNADMAQIAKAQELFEREARTLKSLSHPGIPQFFDFFVEGGKKYLVMEMIQGQDLEKRIFQRGPVSLEQALEWMLQTCEVLQYIHSQTPPIIHRDIKPANLLVRHGNNQIVVLDFGAVKEIGTPPGTRIGVQGYTAPEQDRGQSVIQSDLYAIGSTLVFLLTGESPQKFHEIKGQGFEFNLASIPTIPPPLREVILKVTRPKPGDRYDSALTLATALTGCL